MGAQREGELWIWREYPGDNRCYVKRLDSCWYFYEMYF